MVPSPNSSLLVALQNKFLQLMSKVKHSVHADPFFDPILDRFFLSQLGAHFSCSLYERESTDIFEIRHRTVCNLHIWQSNCSLIIPQRFTQPRLIPIKRHCADLNQLYRVQIRDGSWCEARRYSLTLQVPGSLLSKKACLIYRERSKPSYAQEPRSGSYSGAQHRTHGFILFCFLSGITEAESGDGGEAADENDGLRFNKMHMRTHSCRVPHTQMKQSFSHLFGNSRLSLPRLKWPSQVQHAFKQVDKHFASRGHHCSQISPLERQPGFSRFAVTCTQPQMLSVSDIL